VAVVVPDASALSPSNRAAVGTYNSERSVLHANSLTAYQGIATHGIATHL
jgi:hypothetical protein